MERNPYSPPASDFSDAGLPAVPLENASRGRRFVNWIIDSFGFFLFAIVIGVIVTLAGLTLPENNKLFDWVFGIGVMTAYYLPLELISGRTLGKLITGTRVVTESGAPPTFGQVFARTLIRFVPFEAFSMFRSVEMGWHDSWSGTRVVRTR